MWMRRALPRPVSPHEIREQHRSRDEAIGGEGGLLLRLHSNARNHGSLSPCRRTTLSQMSLGQNSTPFAVTRQEPRTLSSLAAMPWLRTALGGRPASVLRQHEVDRCPGGAPVPTRGARAATRPPMPDREPAPPSATTCTASARSSSDECARPHRPSHFRRRPTRGPTSAMAGRRIRSSTDARGGSTQRACRNSRLSGGNEPG